jgi:membrane protease subunit HflK
MNDPHDHKHPAVQKPTEDAETQALSEALASSFKLVKVIMILLVFVFLGSGIREVGSHERAIKLQFGKAVGSGDGALLDPGWHWAWPFPINEIVKIPIGQVQEVKSTVAFYGQTREQELTGVGPVMMPTLDPRVDGYLLAGDGNIMHSRATMRYRISDPVRYAFYFQNASNVVQDTLDNALNWAAARYVVDDAVRKDVTGFKDEVRRHATETLIAENLGVSIENIEIDSIPPRQVKSAFDEVTGAENTRSKTISEAQADANGALARAVGEADAIINNARASATSQLATVAAEAQYFKDQLKYYQANPELYTARLKAERMGRIMEKVRTKVIQIENDGSTRKELRLQVNREPPPANTSAPSTSAPPAGANPAQH